MMLTTILLVLALICLVRMHRQLEEWVDKLEEQLYGQGDV
jgi:hypothetical protein